MTCPDHRFVTDEISRFVMSSLGFRMQHAA